MDTDAIPPAHKLPPELLTTIFAYSNAAERAQNRSVCDYWRHIIESKYITRLDMYNDNWEQHVKNSTASKIHLILKNVQFPIYIAPEFNDFISRVNILELSGYIPEYNMINILKECRELQSLTISSILYDNYHRLEKLNIEAIEATLDLSQLHIGFPNEKQERALLLMTSIVCGFIKPNCLKKLKLSAFFKGENVLHTIFENVFEELQSDASSDIIKSILIKQCLSLQKISFQSRNRILTTVRTEGFIKLRPYAIVSDSTTNSTNQSTRIYESDLSYLPSDGGRVIRPSLLLKIYQTQSKMKNLNIRCDIEAELDQIQNIIKTNCESLEELKIRLGWQYSFRIQTTRTLSCSCFATCSTLKKLTLHSANRERRVQLFDLLSLPTSLEELSLTGFIPTGSAELFGRVTEPWRYPKLTEVFLGHYPWFIQNGHPITVFEKTHLFWLLNWFSNIRKLTLTPIPLGQARTLQHIREMGLEYILDAVSPEFVTWCRQGGGDNVEVHSFEISAHKYHRDLDTVETVHKICLRNDRHLTFNNPQPQRRNFFAIHRNSKLRNSF